MGTKAAKKVDFKRLADALDGYRFAYLVTVDDDYRVHTVTVEPELRERRHGRRADRRPNPQER